MSWILHDCALPLSYIGCNLGKFTQQKEIHSTESQPPSIKAIWIQYLEVALSTRYLIDVLRSSNVLATVVTCVQ